MIEVRRLMKLGDLLNSEGSILGLHALNDQLFASSHLKNGAGEVFYRVTKAHLAAYLNSEITLAQFYESSEDFLVTQKFRAEKQIFIKSNFTKLIQCGELRYADLSDSMKNPALAELYCR